MINWLIFSDKHRYVDSSINDTSKLTIRPLEENKHRQLFNIRSDLTSVYIYTYHICIRIQDATDLKLKVNRKPDMTGNAMLICTLSTDLQVSMGE